MANTPSGGALPGLSVRVIVDPATLSKTLTFSRPVTAGDASTYLVGDLSLASMLRPGTPDARGASATFQLATHDVDVVMRLRADVRDAIIQGGVIRSTAKPFDLPAWVPEAVKQDLKEGRVRTGVSRYAQPGEWGDVVVWKRNEFVQMYQEFPADIKYYERICGDARQARLVHFAYTQYNKDMREFVDGKGYSPDDARGEIRRINDEVFKLIIEGAVAVLTSGAGIAQVNNVMRADASRIASAAERSPRLRTMGTPKVRPFNGKVNVGGGMETPNMTNLNPIKGNTGGPTSGIPNHVLGSMEQMDTLFEAGSVDHMISNRLRFVDVNWDQATRAAAKAMRPGGKVEMNIWCGPGEAAKVVAAFQRAGFRDVKVIGESVGTMLSAIR